MPAAGNTCAAARASRAGNALTALGAILLVALALRGAYVFELALTPAWHLNTHTAVDMNTHARMAERITGDPFLWGDPRPFYQSPLYPYALAACLWSGLTTQEALVRCQALVGGLTVGATFALGNLVGGSTVGLIAALLLALCRPMVFYTGFFLPAGLEALCAVLWAWSLLAALRRPSPRAFTLAGVLGGLAFLARPNLLAAGGLAVLAWGPEALGRSRWRLWAIFGVAILLTLSPALIRNGRVTGVWTVLPTSGAINFKLGNSVDSMAAGFGYPSGPRLDVLSVEFVSLFFRKLWAFSWDYEIPQNVNMYLVQRMCPTLSAAVVSLALLAAMALVSLSQISRPEVRALWGWGLGYAVSICLFFVVGRFRVPAVPVLCVLASVGLTHAGSLVAPRAGQRRLGILTIWLVSSVGAHFAMTRLPPRLIRTNDYLLMLGGAISSMPSVSLLPLAREGATAFPDLAELVGPLGEVQFYSGDPACVATLERASQLSPDDVPILTLLVSALQQFGKNPVRLAQVQHRLKLLQGPTPSQDTGR